MNENTVKAILQAIAADIKGETESDTYRLRPEFWQAVATYAKDQASAAMNEFVEHLKTK